MTVRGIKPLKLWITFAESVPTVTQNQLIFKAQTLLHAETMTLMQTVYKTLFRRTSTYILTMLTGAVVIERTVDVASGAIWRNINKGRLYEDVKDELCPLE